jgi:hypothetical protein
LPRATFKSAEDAAFEQLHHFQNLKRDSEPLWRRRRCDAAGQSDEFCDELPHARNWCKILPEPCQGPDLPATSQLFELSSTALTIVLTWSKAA